MRRSPVKDNSVPLFSINLMTENKSQINSLWTEVKETIKLNLDYAKLTAAEKVTILLSTIGFVLLAFVMISVVVFFISLGIVILMADSIGMFASSMIMAGIYAVLLVTVFFLRTQLIINPIARFVSHLIIKND